MTAYRAQQIAMQAAIESGDYEKACDILRQDVRTFAQPPPRTGDKNTLTKPHECGILKSCIRWKIRWNTPS